jgi:tRNA_anti-like
MSQNNFHSLYVAPLIVGIFTAAIVGIATYCFSLPADVPSTTQPAIPQTAAPQSTRSSPAEDATFPKDTATHNLLKEFLRDPAAATAHYHGTNVQVCSVIAMLDPSGHVELYGAPAKNKVEGIYFKCSFQKPEDVNGLKPNQLVTLKGKVASYFHHTKSPYIILESCRLVQPSLP